MKDYYRILEISPSASFEVIKASYRALAKKYHPDTQASSNMEKTMADMTVEEKVGQLFYVNCRGNEAYETLSNSQSRKEYDQQYSRFINSTKSCEKKVSENDAGSQLNKTTTSEKSSNEPDSRHGFFSFVKKVGSAIVEDYTQTCERRNREIENAYIRAQRLPDDRLIYCFRTSGGAEKIGYARELEHRDYLYLDSDGVYQATYKYKNFRY